MINHALLTSCTCDHNVIRLGETFITNDYKNKEKIRGCRFDISKAKQLTRTEDVIHTSWFFEAAFMLQCYQLSCIHRDQSQKN